MSTFAGCGGSSTGYVWAGGKVLLAVEWDNNAVATYRLNYPDTDIYHGDIAKLSVDEVLQRTGLQPGELDIFDGSPPCQGFSTAGKRDFDDDRNQLFREYVRLLRGLQPKVFVMENVSGMVKGKMKLIFADILKELKASGYRVSARLLNAMYLGVPQSRQRMIFIGVREDLGIEPSHPKPQTRPITVKDAIPYAINIATNSSMVSRWIDAQTNVSPTITKTVGNEKGGMIEVEIVEDMLLQDNRLTRLYDSVPVGGSAEDVTQKGKNFNNIKKPHPNKPMFSIPKTVTNRGGFSICHWQEKRLLSIAELKRLASYPDCYQFAGRFVEQWARIGNSVPPRMMQYVAEHIYEHILKMEKVGS
ncbi:MAG: DNA cytosine methyltransferase [Aggregatilineales bacterium]